MIRIGIELNHVVRNLNKQVIKYYCRDVDPSLDPDKFDYKDDVFKIFKFDDERAKNDFIYIDYPYELFGCAKAMDGDLPREMNKWLYEITNYEDDEVEVFYYSMGEDSLTIQSSYFFLSKIGTRVRKVLFPLHFSEVLDNADVIVSASEKSLYEAEGKYRIKIKNNFNGDGKADAEYDSLIDMMKDEELLNKLHKHITEK